MNAARKERRCYSRVAHSRPSARAMSSSTSEFERAFGTPRYMSPEEEKVCAAQVAKSEAIVHDRKEVDHEEQLRSATTEFLNALDIQRSASDDEVYHMLHFVVANGTTYTGADCVDSECILDPPQNGERFHFTRLCLSSIFVDVKSNIFGLVGYGKFYPLTGIFDVLHKGGVGGALSTEGNHYSSITWNSAKSDSFFSQGPTRKLFMSSKQCSESLRYHIFNRNDIILNEDWLILERWIDTRCEHSGQVFSHQVPIVFSDTGIRYNWIDPFRRSSLEAHLKEHEVKVFGYWKDMLATCAPDGKLMSFWKKLALRRLIDIKVFSEQNLVACMEDIVALCPVNVMSGMKYPLRPHLYERIITRTAGNMQHTVAVPSPAPPGLPSNMHSIVSSLNELFRNRSLMEQKPEFIDHPIDTKVYYDYHNSRYHDRTRRAMKIGVRDSLLELGYEFDEGLLMGQRSRESRKNKVQIIEDLFRIHPSWEEFGVYGYFNEYRDCVRHDEIGPGNDEGYDGKVLIDGEHWPHDVDTELLIELCLNLEFYMRRLPRIVLHREKTKAWEKTIISNKLCFYE